MWVVCWLGSAAVIGEALQLRVLTYKPRSGHIVAPPCHRRSAIPLTRRKQPAMTELVPIDEKWSTTASGLKFLDDHIGDGETPEAGDVVKVAYTGWLEKNGLEFDSTKGRSPFAFVLGQQRVIPGWDEGISSMRVGGKRQLCIPAELGYGQEGSGSIPSGAMLRFECELVSIESGFSGFIATFPGGITNFALTSILALSFVPYLLPEEVKPTFWK